MTPRAASEIAFLALIMQLILIVLGTIKHFKARRVKKFRRRISGIFGANQLTSKLPFCRNKCTEIFAKRVMKTDNQLSVLDWTDPKVS